MERGDEKNANKRKKQEKFQWKELKVKFWINTFITCWIEKKQKIYLKTKTKMIVFISTA